MRGVLKAGLLGLCLLAVYPVTAAEPEAGSRSASQKLERYEFLQIQMGIPFRITLYGADEGSANAAAREAYRRVKQLNAIFSDYDPDSELSLLCRSSGPGKPVKIGEDMRFVISRSLELSTASEGAFDVTVGPVVKLWRKARRKQQLPDPTALKNARALVGYQSVRFDAQAGTVELLKPGMQLDFGGIAKGYAAREALKVLNEHGITRALVAGAGDIVAGDAPPDADGWKIGIAALQKPDAEPMQFVNLKNASISTSGDAFQATVVDGVRYSHIVDPMTGMGLTRQSSVTVITRDGATADGLASATSVLGPERGMKFIESIKGTEALFVELHEGEVRTRRSPGFAKYEVKN